MSATEQGSDMVGVSRESSNPIIGIENIRPLDGFEVVGVFNPGVTRFEDKTLLLLRVAERPADRGDGMLRVPYFNREIGSVSIKAFDKSDPAIDFSDSRVVVDEKGRRYLTSLSSFMLAQSRDGVHFTVDPDFRLRPGNRYEAYGIEDARITHLEDKYYIQYTAASEYGICAAMIHTRDFAHFSSPVIIMHPDNKDIALFPQTIGGQYYMLHRPSTSEFATPNIWIACSRDLKGWGEHRVVMTVRPGMWDEKRIGASSVPISTADGWLILYHGADRHNRYCLGAALLDPVRPWKVLARSREPFMVPTEGYEKDGFFGNVIFSCGCLVENGVVHIYYGAADRCVCLARIGIDALLDTLRKEAA